MFISLMYCTKLLVEIKQLMRLPKYHEASCCLNSRSMGNLSFG